MPMGVFYAYMSARHVGAVYTLRGFLHCLFGCKGFPRTSISE